MTRVTSYATTALVIVSCVVALALPWELRAAIESILPCAGERAFLGTGRLLTFPLVLSLALLTQSAIAARRLRRCDVRGADLMALAAGFVPGAIAWWHLHRWRCFADAFPYHAPLTRTELPYLPYIVRALESPFELTLTLAATTLVAIAAVFGVMFWPAGRQPHDAPPN